ncbi:hypothetical protein FPCIR_1416 [Fusarium pseudocircinatum]|uniref:Uncharacterized protein n=1 Tax=Fusarium pseudocircinatum TaxID=56676 RepID=A0A8H5PTL2_9HYPO|nr:hypothetical protein FPCIR_1416 [Fusarium pseudocircinatum]
MKPSAESGSTEETHPDTSTSLEGHTESSDVQEGVGDLSTTPSFSAFGGLIANHMRENQFQNRAGNPEMHSQGSLSQPQEEGGSTPAPANHLATGKYPLLTLKGMGGTAKW